MNISSKITRKIWTLVLACCSASCNYLDIIPPAQADFEDTMKDESATLDFLYTCYGGIPRSNPFHYHAFEYSADEVVMPKDYSNWQQQVAWGTIAPTYTNSWGGDDMNIWLPSYNYLGYVHHFLSLIDDLQPVGVTEEDKEQYKAECWFLEAYYHFRVLEAFGPCPLITAKVDPNITKEQLPGRSHFDYCVKYIVDKLDAAAKILPPEREDQQELGRATSIICKALKARVLLYAASPLWNGNFPYPNWRNINYETPGYGKELVSSVEDPKKWETALTACQEALDLATEGQRYELFSVEMANAKAAQQGNWLPFVPGKDPERDREFLERVRMFQYLSTAHEGDGNKEIIWGQRIDIDGNNKGEAIDSRLPNKVVKKSNGEFVGGWGTYGPTLYAIQHFYTENGKLPSKDSDFYPERDWYKRFNESAVSPALTVNDLDKEDVQADIIKLNTKREARFYAWIAYDGCQYSPKISNNGPLWLNLKNTNTNGWSPDNTRNCVGTGYLSKKFVDPDAVFRADGSRTSTAIRRPFIRLAELYLNLAECHAALGHTTEALTALNVIRRRAGFKDLKEADLTSDMNLMDWVRNERFVELFEEGHRYYDLRRWCLAPEMLRVGTRYGLNGLQRNPSFEDFNKPVLIDQPFMWNNRLYLLPVWSRTDMDELYSNPQLVQSPEY